MNALNYKKYGTGRPIIILHGLFGMLDNWQTIAKMLVEYSYQIFLLDQRNHGRSPHTETHSYGDLAEDLHQFIEDKKIKQPLIIGHSMGAKTVMQYVLRYRKNVAAAVLVDMSPLENEPGHEEVFDALKAVPIESLKSRDEAQEHMSTFLKDRSVVLFLMKNLSRKKEGGFRWKMNLPVLLNDYQEILREISSDNPFEKPVMAIKGELSDYLTYDGELALFRLFPNLSIEEIEEAGHWVHADQPEALLHVLLDFMNNIGY